MRILVTADLHYDIRRSRGPAGELAERVCGQKADALLLLGDVCGRSLDVMTEALRLFDRFAGPKMFVAGNHDVWTGLTGDSLDRYEVRIAEVCRRHGWHYLDESPLYVNGVAFVGNMGWYDHSYRLKSLGVPLRFYAAKIAPGAAAVLPGYTHLLNGLTDTSGQALEITTRWMDGRYVHLPWDDEEFTRRLADKLRRHLDEAARRTHTIIAGMHHVPFEQLVVRTGHANWDFATNYMGSEVFGRTVLSEPKVTHLFCAHSHRAGRLQRGHLTCMNVGSTYTDKRVIQVDVANGRVHAAWQTTSSPVDVSAT
jgi:predicted phosphohydrolase